MLITNEWLGVEGKNMPLFSIIVLCYKNTNMLEGMVKTILDQDYPNIELIVSDDGSDNFDCDTVRADILNLMRSQKDCNITNLIVRKNEVNQKTVKHFSEVLPCANGDYVVFTAADDRFSNNKIISVYANTFNENPNTQWLLGRCTIMSEDFKKAYHVLPSDEDITYLTCGDPIRLYSRWCRRGMAIPCCMAFRRGAFDLVGGIDLNYTFLEDWPLVLKLLLNRHMPIYVKEYAAIHGAGGITNSNDRYGIMTRKAFYDDKYRLINTITRKNMHLLGKDDRKIVEKYIHEIMDRNYFLHIEKFTHSKPALLLKAVAKPCKLFWLFEDKINKIASKLQAKKLLAVSQIMLIMAGLLFLYSMTKGPASGVFCVIGWGELILSLLLAVVSLASAFFKRYIARKAKFRKSLVN